MKYINVATKKEIQAENLNYIRNGVIDEQHI
jgi:hypothetical protein